MSSSPPKRTEPDTDLSIPMIERHSVDLPIPLRPMMAIGRLSTLKATS